MTHQTDLDRAADRIATTTELTRDEARRFVALFAPVVQACAQLARPLAPLAASLRGIHPPVIGATPRGAHTPTPGMGTPHRPHLPPAPVHAPLTRLARAHTPTPPGPLELTEQRRQDILDVLRHHDAAAWEPQTHRMPPRTPRHTRPAGFLRSTTARPSDRRTR